MKPIDPDRRDQMIARIAEEWVDGIDIKDYLRSMLIEYTDELGTKSDKDIQEEFDLVTGGYE